MHSPSQGGLAARPGRSPGMHGRVGRERAGRRAGSAAGVLCGAGIAGHPVCWPKAVGAGISVRGSSHSPSRGGLAARAGAPEHMQGREGRMWCGIGRPAGRERGRSALQGSRAGDRRRCPVRAGILGLLRPNGIASPPPPGAGSKGGARRSMCGAGRGWDGICRPAGGSGRAGQGIATFCAGAEVDRPGIGALGTLHPPSPEGGWRRGRRGGRVCGAERGGEGVEGRAGWERAALRRVPCFPRGVLCILESATHA